MEEFDLSDSLSESDLASRGPKVAQSWRESMGLQKGPGAVTFFVLLHVARVSSELMCRKRLAFELAWCWSRVLGALGRALGCVRSGAQFGNQGGNRVLPFDAISHVGVKFDGWKIGQHALARCTQVVVVCGNLSFEAELRAVVERGFLVIGCWARCDVSSSG